jgi:hypothetical protein
MMPNSTPPSADRQVIAVLCHTETCCPTIALDPAADESQQVVIQDDFGQAVQMSRQQFQVLIDLAQQGKLVL